MEVGGWNMEIIFPASRAKAKSGPSVSEGCLRYWAANILDELVRSGMIDKSDLGESTKFQMRERRNGVIRCADRTSVWLP